MLSELLLVDPATGQVSPVGERGEGSGEVPAVVDAALAWGDSIVVAGGDRILVVGPTGRPSRVVRLPVEAWGASDIVGSTVDRVVLESDLLQVFPDGLGIDSIRILVLDRASGAVTDSISLANRMYYHRDDPGAPSFLTYPPFFPQGIVAVHESQIFHAVGDNPWVFRLGAGGVAEDSFRIVISSRELSSEEITRALEDRMERASARPDLRRNWIRMFEEVRFPDAHPYFDALLSGEDGLLWVRQALRASDSEVVWWGHDPEGGLVRRLVVPVGWDIQQIHNDRAVVVVRNDLDVPEIRVLRLEPTG